jgi:hypothetical protein
LDNRNVAFVGGSSSEQQGIYTKIGGTLNVVADTNTPIPNGTGNFAGFVDFSQDNQNVTFVGYNSSQSGIYTNIARELKVLADRNTPIPNGAGNFASFGGLSLDKKDVAFLGFDSSNQTGIYTKIGGKLNVVADTNTPIPGGTENFIGFGIPSLDKGNVAFLGFGSSIAGMYTTLGGSLTKVIAINDSLDGKIVNSLNSEREALNRNRIAFFVGFTDGSQAIYIATLKGPKTNTNQVSGEEL